MMELCLLCQKLDTGLKYRDRSSQTADPTSKSMRKNIHYNTVTVAMSRNSILMHYQNAHVRRTEGVKVDSESKRPKEQSLLPHV